MFVIILLYLAQMVNTSNSTQQPVLGTLYDCTTTRHKHVYAPAQTKSCREMYSNPEEEFTARILRYEPKVSPIKMARCEAKYIELKCQEGFFGAKDRPVYLLFRIISSAGAAGLWFSASWLDMIVAGSLGLVVALFEGATLWKHERMILEVIASWVVGLVAGLLSLSFPSHLCFGGMAVGAVVDILQGFRVVYSIMEIMSKHTVAGGADFLEVSLQHSFVHASTCIYLGNMSY